MAADVTDLIEAFLAERPTTEYGFVHSLKLSETKTGPALLALGAEDRAAVVAAILPRIIEADRLAAEFQYQTIEKRVTDPEWQQHWKETWTPQSISS